MGRWEFTLPDIGEGIAEGEVVAWLVAKGDQVTEDQPMVEVMTDKATVVISSPRTGKIAELGAKVGELVKVHATLVVFDLGSADTNDAVAPSSHETPKEPAATAVGDIREDLPGMGMARVAGAPGAAVAATVARGYFNDKPLATPATRKTARELGVDLRAVPPARSDGRVTKDDVVAFAKPETSAVSTSTVAASAHRTTALARSSVGNTREPVRIEPAAGAPGTEPLEERVPFAGLRRKIAQKMQASTQTAAHFTFVEECDVTALKALRARLRPEAERRGVTLTYLPFIVKAVVASLKRHPILNSALDETTNELVYRRYYHVGIAASTDAGLIVPVVKHADRRSLLDVAKEIDRLATEAKAGRAKVDDLTGSTFTITSLGKDGGFFATPIINFPEVAILGVHRIKERPVVKDGQVVIGDVMLLSLSFDHRIVDGHVGAAFAYEVIGYLENPDRLFLDLA